MLCGLLGAFPVLGKEKVPGSNWTANRWQFGRVITCPNLPFGETDKVDVFQMSAMVVDIIFITSGVIRASVKILALILVLVVKMHNVAFCTTKHFVLVLLALWVTHVKSVFLMWMNVLQILVGPIQDVSI